ncbi:MAG: hypothetical protein EOP69_01705 [Spirochaetia bacterium]|nr:MAG: hypothetical protein EOP69_01705 [Spirochaetia bacterium]
MLVESLIHELTAKSILTIPEAIAIVEVALEAQITEQNDTPRELAGRNDRPQYLEAILRTLQIDSPDK